MGEANEKIEVSKKNGVLAVVHMICVAAALVLAIVGIVRISNIGRLIIYIGQGLICIAILVLGLIHFKDGSRKYLHVILIAYAFLEALRVALLSTDGVNQIVGYVARFFLAVLACACILLAERMDKADNIKIAISVVVLEVALYLVFLFGFPGVMLGHLNRFLPLVGVLITASVGCALQAEQ